MVIVSPFGTPSMYFETGSSSDMRPSCTNCRMAVTVIVFVLLPIRTWSSAEIGSSVSRVDVPKVPVQSPRSGELICITAPGMALSRINWSMVDSNSATYAGCA